MENAEKSSPTLSASFFHWALIDRQDLSGSFIGRRRMINRGLIQELISGILQAAAKRLLTWEPATLDRQILSIAPTLRASNWTQPHHG